MRFHVIHAQTTNPAHFVAIPVMWRSAENEAIGAACAGSNAT